MSGLEDRLRKLLPASFKDLPFVQYHKREAETTAEYYSDVEYGVANTKDLGIRLFNRTKRKP